MRTRTPSQLFLLLLLATMTTAGLGCGDDPGTTGDSNDTCPGCDTGPTPTPGMCFGDVPCGPAAVRMPARSCPSSRLVTSVGPSTTGYRESSLSLPAVGARVAEPDFGTCMTRATPRGLDERLLALHRVQRRRLAPPRAPGGGAWYLLDADALGTPTRALGDLRRRRRPALARPRPGRALLPRRRAPRALPGELRRTTTVALDVAAVPGLAGCGGVDNVSLGGSEGDGSAGEPLLGLPGDDRASCRGNDQHFVTADLETGETLGPHAARGRRPARQLLDEPDRQVLHRQLPGQPCAADGTLARPCGVMAYTLHLDAAFMVHPSAGHHDEALGRDGHDVVVVKSNTTDFIEAIDLETAGDPHRRHEPRRGGVGLPHQRQQLGAARLGAPVRGLLRLERPLPQPPDRRHRARGHGDRAGRAPRPPPHPLDRVLDPGEPRQVNADLTRIAFHSNWYGGPAKARTCCSSSRSPRARSTRRSGPARLGGEPPRVALC